MNNPVAKAMCLMRKHRVNKSKGVGGETWSCTREGCEWTKKKR